MILENKLIDASETISQRFLMLVQAMSGIRALTSISINDLQEQDLLDEALDVLIQNLDFERCSVFLLNNNEELYCATGKDWKDRDNTLEVKERKLSHTFKLGQGIIGQAAKNRQIYHCKNCKQDKNYLSIIHTQVDTNVGSLICVPIITSDELLGVLNISHPEPFFFHPWQEHVICIHANILAQLLYNHRLVEDMTTQVNNRTKELQFSLEETETLKSKYQTLSVIDDLTQIYNRRYFFSEVPAALARALRYNQSINILFIDIDYFKSVNDSYGHEVGDKVLKDVASVLSRQLRKGDILARMGGEEFALVVPNTDVDGIQLLAQRIKGSISRQSWEHQGQSFSITMSIGISELRCPENHGHSYLNHINEITHVLIREADQALYHCKETGRDKITFYRDLKDPQSRSSTFDLSKLK
jgi:diguanylate cyclase (GGDEF)-like protein